MAVTVTLTGTMSDIQRSDLAQESLACFQIPLTQFRQAGANELHTNLPGTAASDDLALIGGTFGTSSPTIQTSDSKATTVTQYARCLFALPPEYTSGQRVKIRIHAGMNTTISDDTATVDVQCYESDLEAGIGSDLCTTAAQSINSLTDADFDFIITPTSLAPGDVLDIRVCISINDAATGTAVIGQIGSVELLCDIKG